VSLQLEEEWLSVSRANNNERSIRPPHWEREMTIGSRLARDHLKSLNNRISPFFNSQKKKKKQLSRKARWVGKQEGRDTPNRDLAAEEKALFPFEAAKQRDLLDPTRPLSERPLTAADSVNHPVVAGRVLFRELRVPYEHLFLDGRPYAKPVLHRGPKGTAVAAGEAAAGTGSSSSAPAASAAGNSWLEQYRNPKPKPARVPLHAKCMTQAEEMGVPDGICVHLPHENTQANAMNKGLDYDHALNLSKYGIRTLAGQASRGSGKGVKGEFRGGEAASPPVYEPKWQKKWSITKRLRAEIATAMSVEGVLHVIESNGLQGDAATVCAGLHRLGELGDPNPTAL